jgi:hypothetical protein
VTEGNQGVKENLLVIRSEHGNVEIDSHPSCEFRLTQSYRDNGKYYIEGTVVLEIPQAKTETV